MNNKELLEKIKNQFNQGRMTIGSGASFVSDEHIEWLIEQAEKVEQLQQENERLKKFLNWEQEEAQGLDEEVTFQLEQLKQAQAKIERYEKALKEIIEGEGVRLNFIGESNSEALEIAKQALDGDEN